MEGFSVVKELLFFFQSLGPWGIVGFLWWQGQRDRKKENEKWEERFESVVRMYEDAVKRYEDNVKLVKGYEKISSDQQDIILLNTQAWTKLTTIIETRGMSI